MDFLKLCTETARDSGTVAGIPSFTTVVGATGRIAQVVGWVRDAWIDIQNERNDWLWMRRRFDQPLVIATNTYAPASLSLTRVSRWLPDRIDHTTFSLYDPAIGKKDEGSLRQISYDLWVDKYARGVHDNQRPSHWAVSPTNELLIGPTPDKAYRICGEYRVKAQELVANADIPEMPDEYHRLIVVEAIRLMARSDEAFPVLQAYGDEYARIRNALVREQTPEADIRFGGSLA